MKIAHVVYPSYPLPLKAYGGVERGVYLLAREQARRGHQVTVFAHRDSKIEGCQIVGCLSKDPGMKKNQTSLVLLHCRNEMIDIIHDHSPWGTLGSTVCGCPVIRTIYGDPFKKYVHTLRQDTVISFTTNAFAAFYGYAGAPIIRPAISENPNTKPFNSGNRKEWLVFVGVMNKYKGPQTAIKWANRLGRNLLLLGPKKDERFFETQIQPHCGGIYDNSRTSVEWINKLKPTTIVYGGIVARDFIWDIYLQAHAVLVTSECVEAMSRVVQEAMLTGCPVYAHAVGGIPEVMGEVGGINTNDVEDVIAYDRANDYDPVAARDRICKNRYPGAMYDDCHKLYMEAINNAR